MADPLTYLQQRLRENWLLGAGDRFAELTELRSQELTQRLNSGILPTVLLVESEPVRFLAGFAAACALGCPVFLGNPGWVRAEWQQIWNLMQPNLVWGDRPHLPLQMFEESKPHTQGWIMIPTGGSSGQIRFVIHTWATLMASVQAFRQHFQLQQVNSCCVLPLYHVSGLIQFLRSFTSGGKLAILPFKALEAGTTFDLDPTGFFLSLVPTQLQRLLQTGLIDWLTQFQAVLLGGAPAWSELLLQARQHRIPLAPTYGMTETAAQIATLKPEAFLQGHNSCGQVLPHAHITIHDSAGQQLRCNQVGGITIQAASLALGYYPDCFAQRDFQSDDLGFVDSQGELNVVGRSSNKIITGGENVFPAEVEAIIRATDLVTDVCVIGLPDQHWGEVVTAIYVPKHDQISAKAISAELTDKLSRFKQPKRLISAKELPRNAQGKINYEQMSDRISYISQYFSDKRLTLCKDAINRVFTITDKGVDNP